MMTRRALILSALAAPFVLSLPRLAHAAQDPVFSKDGVAINGTDPVAYFTESRPVAGSTDITHDWNGATWRFASAANRDAFAADPEAYAPQYGGYCAYAVSKGGTAKTDPDAWSVHNGKLYLNFNTTVRGIWSKDKDGNIAKADANWPDVLSR